MHRNTNDALEIIGVPGIKLGLAACKSRALFSYSSALWGWWFCYHSLPPPSFLSARCGLGPWLFSAQRNGWCVQWHHPPEKCRWRCAHGGHLCSLSPQLADWGSGSGDRRKSIKAREIAQGIRYLSCMRPNYGLIPGTTRFLKHLAATPKIELNIEPEKGRMWPTNQPPFYF